MVKMTSLKAKLMSSKPKTFFLTDPVQKPITGNGAVPNHPLSVIFTTTLCSSLIYLLQLH